MRKIVPLALLGISMAFSSQGINAQRERRKHVPPRRPDYIRQLSTRLDRLERALKRVSSTLSAFQKRFVAQEKRLRKLEGEFFRARKERARKPTPVPRRLFVHPVTPKTKRHHVPESWKKRLESFKKRIAEWRKQKERESKKGKERKHHRIRTIRRRGGTVGKGMPFKGLMILKRLHEKEGHHKVGKEHHEHHGCPHHKAGKKHYGHHRCPHCKQFYMMRRYLPFIIKVLRSRLGERFRQRNRNFRRFEPRLRLMMLRYLGRGMRCHCFHGHGMHHGKHGRFEHEKHERHGKHGRCEHEGRERHEKHGKHGHFKHEKHEKHGKHGRFEHEEHERHEKRHGKDHHKKMRIRIFQV